VKYIVTRLDDKECIFVFPRTVDHDRMWEAMEAIRFGDHRNWERKLRDGEAISAGFVANGVCHGRSETLNLASRGAKDTELLKGSQHG
jgi:hypothetical protein